MGRLGLFQSPRTPCHCCRIPHPLPLAELRLEQRGFQHVDPGSRPTLILWQRDCYCERADPLPSDCDRTADARPWGYCSSNPWTRIQLISSISVAKCTSVLPCRLLNRRFEACVRLQRTHGPTAGWTKNGVQRRRANVPTSDCRPASVEPLK